MRNAFRRVRSVIVYLRNNKIVPVPLCTGLYKVKSKVAYNDVMFAFNCANCSKVHLIAS
jgi:hypothetical protein